MKRHILLIGALLLPGLAFAGPNPSGRFDRNAQNMMLINEMQRQSSVREQEWRRRDDEQRRRVEEERRRETWRRDEERRRDAARRQDERARYLEERQIYEERRQSGFRREPARREAQNTENGRSGAYREPEYRGRPLNPKELRRYELLKPGDRP